MNARLAVILATGVAVAVGTSTIGALLSFLVHRGWAHSFDTAIYVRSLWGVANGSFHNTMVDLHVLSVHFNLVLFVLAPLTRWLRSVDVLVLSQALAFGATVGLAAGAVTSTAIRAGRAPIVSLAFGAGFALIAGTSPLVVNPFLFDIRPDLIGVPLLTAGLIRAQQRGRVDLVAVCGMLSSLLVREEFMIVIVGALGVELLVRGRSVVLARRRNETWSLKELTLPLAGIGAAVTWLAVYWFVIRAAIGDGSHEVANEVASSFFAEPDAVSWRHRGLWAGVFAASLGGLSLLGIRWLGAAVPGFLLLLVTQRLPELALNFHYLMFMTPGLIVAGVHGLGIALQRPRSIQGPLVLGVATLAIGSFVFTAALPGGGRYRDENFGVLGDMTVEDLAEADELAQMHVLAASIPRDEGFALPWGIAGAVSDREAAYTIEAVEQGLRRGEPLPEGILWIGVAARDWSRLGRWAVQSAGYRPVAIVGEKFALLTRKPIPVSWEALGAVPGYCDAPVARWENAGVIVCSVNRRDDGIVEVGVQRIPGSIAEASRLGVCPPGGNEPFVDLLALRGMIELAQIAPGYTMTLRSASAIDATAIDIAVFGSATERISVSRQ